MDKVLRLELGSLYVGLPHFRETYFEGVAGLEAASEAVFGKCKEGSNPLFSELEGWCGWPKDANQDDVLSWFADLSDRLVEFAEDYKSPTHRRRPMAQPSTPIQDPQEMDVGFVNNAKAGKDSQCHWPQILVLG